MNVLRVARVLCGAGYDVHLATYSMGETIPVDGLTYHRAIRVPWIHHVGIGFSARKVVLDAALALLVWRLQLVCRFDVVHAVEESVFFAMPLSLARRIPLIYDIDSVLSDQLGYSGAIRSRGLLGLVRRLERASLRRSTAAITVCTALTDTVRALEPGVRVVQIEDCPVAEAAPPRDPATVAALRREFDLPGGPLALYAGNFEPYQGLDLLLSGWPAVHERVPAARLVIVGGAPEEVRTRRAALDALGRAAATVRFVGSVAPERLPRVLAAADVLVSPRRLGTNTPLKLYSYMASGVPIVATNLRTHTQVLDDSTAVLVAPEANAIGEAVAEVLEAPGRFAALADAARERVEERYSEREFARKLLDMYDEVLSARGPGAEP